MTIKEWKTKLIPAGILLICYFLVPGLVQWFLGAGDVISGGFTFSTITQAGIGLAIVYKFFSLKLILNAELLTRLNRFEQPQAKTQQLAGEILLAAGFVSIVAFIGPPAGELLPGSRLMTLVKLSALGYAGYLAYTIWKLAEPFISYVPSAAPFAAPPAAVSERRCVKCGQLIDDSMKVCAFCKRPIY